MVAEKLYLQDQVVHTKTCWKNSMPIAHHPQNPRVQPQHFSQWFFLLLLCAWATTVGPQKTGVKNQKIALVTVQSALSFSQNSKLKPGNSILRWHAGSTVMANFQFVSLYSPFGIKSNYCWGKLMTSHIDRLQKSSQLKNSFWNSRCYIFIYR